MIDDLKEGGMIPRTLRNWFDNDRSHWKNWREEAELCYAFVAGDQYSDEEKERLQDKMRPIITFNRLGVVVDSIHGHEIGNRREVRYIPREMGDALPNELLTSAAQWFRDQAHADDEESDAFLDVIIAGLGCTETRVDYDAKPEGKPDICRCDPIEMYPDHSARRRNLVDGKRVSRLRRIPYREAKEMWPDYSMADMDAAWTSEHIDDEQYEAGLVSNDDDGDGMCHIVQMQWMEFEHFYQSQDPITGEAAQFTEKEFKTLNKRMKMTIGTELSGVRRRRRIVKQAFLGNVVLESGDAPCPTHFSFQFITGKRDRNKGTWYGIVRPMIDPQRWANKWLSQMMHILNTNAKGGLLAEKGAFEDRQQAEASWAHSDEITWLQDGALTGKKIKEKPPSQFPTGFDKLTEFAISSIRDTSGVNVEMLGMREATQAASLEQQRRQAGMTILQPFFDSLKHYRELQGEVMLYIIRNDLSDGRLIKIVGKGMEQYVPLLKSVSEEYDIIVDDAPNSPNQKEIAWDMMTQLMPVIGKNLPPEIMVKMMEYSPLPTSIVMQLQQMVAKIKQEQQPMVQKKQQMEEATIGSEIELRKAQSFRAVQEGQASTMRAQMQGQKNMADGQLQGQKQQHTATMDQASLALDIMQLLADREQPASVEG